MTSTSGTDNDNGARGFHSRAARVRTDVHAVPLAAITDPAVHRAVRLIRQLAKVFPGQIIELDLTPSTTAIQRDQHGIE